MHHIRLIFAALAVVVCLDAAAQCPTPVITAPVIAPRTHSYTISWDGNLAQTANFELQEATTDTFADAITIAVSNALSRTISAHSEVVADKRFYYRVRGLCSVQAGAYSQTASTIVSATLSDQAREYSIGIPAGTTQPFLQDFLVPGFGETATSADTFNLTLDAPWVSVFPATGALSAGGTTVRLTIDPTKLKTGTSRATLTVQTIQTARTATVAVPIAVSLAPRISPIGRNASAQANMLIIPVAHADVVNSRFESDVRLVNTVPQTVTYELSYTPTQTDGTISAKRMTIDVASNETISFDDIVKMFFGSGLLGEVGVGSLEIRPIRASDGSTPSASTTFASSRTYNTSSAGTLGQYIPALARSAFIGDIAADPLAKISLQQIGSNSNFRTNVGFVEGNGQPVEINVRLINAVGEQIRQITMSLAPFEHRQMNLNDVRLFPEVTINDARVEVEVTSATGLVTAYASVLDNQTSDPLLVSPIQAGRNLTSRTVLPGVAELTTARNFHTDMRIFNAGASPVTVTLSYRPQTGDNTPVPQVFTHVLDAKHVLSIDNVLPTLWGLSATGGAVTLTTPSSVPLVVSARTFSRNATNATYGQFIPGVRPVDAAGAGDRALEVLQLEQSSNFRSNLGLFEVTGNPATVEITGYSSDTTTDPMVIEVSGGEFRQLTSVFAQLGLPTVYSGRIRVRVISGSGRVSAYASVIDSRTEDPTYIPAQ